MTDFGLKLMKLCLLLSTQADYEWEWEYIRLVHAWLLYWLSLACLCQYYLASARPDILIRTVQLPSESPLAVG